ncbi:MAG TPA: hypothetical protein VFQ61_26315 [Polyangiaceae bacterium]|nr:hypothetical protein [Polyangiaceae bacterium]
MKLAWLRSVSAWCLALAGVAIPATAAAQVPPPGYGGSGTAYTGVPNYGAPPQGYGYSTAGYGSSSRRRSVLELGALYATSVAYGAGVGIWIDAEARVKDPGVALIAPAVLGVAAPAAVYFADVSPMPRGVPAAIAAGAVIGAGEGIGIASLQFVTSDKEDAWGFRGLARATALGATLGGVGGAALGYLQRPSPRSSVLMTSSVAWGSAIGAMFGYGSTGAGVGYGRGNDRAAWGGLIGYNVGLVATAALSTVYIPTTLSLEWMWAGAGIGFAASLPVYLFYIGDGGPPGKRGLLFSGTATTLGIVGGALLTAESRESAAAPRPSRQFARITNLLPMLGAGNLGLSLAGEIE